MTEKGQKRFYEIAAENKYVATYYQVATQRWWCMGHAPTGMVLARWPIGEFEFDNLICCSKCGRHLNGNELAYTEVE